MAISNQKIDAFIVDAWGHSGTALLPATLRELWADEPLPLWVRDQLALADGTTLAALGPATWDPTVVTRRVRTFLVNFVTARLAEIEPLRVLDGPWPPALLPSHLPWTNRTRNCLERAGLLANREKLSAVTYGQLLDVPSMGVVSMLDFACVSEAGVTKMTGANPVQDSQRDSADGGANSFSDALVAALNASWVNQISGRDPRFADLLPTGEGTVFERIDQLTGQPQERPDEIEKLATAVAAIHARADEISRLSLDRALAQFLKALSGLNGPKLEALSARLGWSGSPPITLEEAGASVGLSRERMRQLQKRTLDRLPQHTVFMPSLDDAIKLLREKAPIAVDDATELLRRQKLVSIDFCPESLLSAANLCGRPNSFQLELIRGQSRVVTSSQHPHADALVSIAHKQAAASGASNVQEVVAEAVADGLKVEESVAREVLTHYADVEFLEGDWFWYFKGKQARNRLRNVTRKMLSVAAPIHISALREGTRRGYSFRGARGLGTWPLTVPPRSVMKRFFEAHPEFVIDEDGFVAPSRPLDYRMELMATEQVLVDVLRSSPACVLDRASCAQGCLDRGMNHNTFALYLTYSPVIEHVGTDIWSLRGVHVDPTAVEALRRANAIRPRERRVVDHGWTGEGRLWVAFRLPSITTSRVFGMPATIERFVAGRDFPASDEKGTPSGIVKVTEDGTSYGYGPFLTRRGGDEDDILIVEFDLVVGTSVLRLGDDEMLDEWDPTL